MKYQEILEKLTLEQKCALLSGADEFKTRQLPKAGIPSIRLADGPHGLRKQLGASDHLGLNPSEPATCFPTASAVACSWDVRLAEKIGEALAEEAVEQDVNVILGPGLNIKRSPLCGRNFEYFSEDPFLSGKLAAGYVRGIQSKGVAACPKHFAVNSQETGRMVSDSILDERTLREIYLTGFEIAVKEGNPKCLMTSYNLVNGIYANENRHLLKEILRDEWGFRGAVVTDWGGSNDHALGVREGSSLEMPAPGWDSVWELLEAVKSGRLTEADVDARTGELLELVFSTDDALKKAKKKEKDGTHGAKTPDSKKAHHELARRAAAESLTLLKNEGGLLPLAPGTRVALIGDFAERPRYQGAGSSQVNVLHPDSICGCIENSGLELAGFARGFHRLGRPDETMRAEAVSLAARAEAVLLCLGLDELNDSEGLDRSHLRLAENQILLLHEVSAVNPNVIVALSAGGAIETDWLDDCRALLYTALGGEAGAAAAVDAVTGGSCPGGRLAESWPRRYEDTPAKEHFAGPGHRVEYREGLYVGYRYYQKKGIGTAFPFGYGLSYTAFSYSCLQADERQVSFTVTNTGTRKGTETAQLYVSKPEAAVFRPVRELKGFAKVELKAGESKRVTLPLDDKAFRYWNVRTGRWETEGGEYLLQIGASCEDLRLSAVVTLQGTQAPAPYEQDELPHYRTGDVQQVPDREFRQLLGRELSPEKREIGRNMTLGELRYGRSPLGWLVSGILTLLLRRSLKRGRPDLNLLFLYHMPLRAMAKMTGGRVSMEMVDGIVTELKGFWLVGLARVLIGFVKNRYRKRRMESRDMGIL